MFARACEAQKHQQHLLICDLNGKIYYNLYFSASFNSFCNIMMLLVSFVISRISGVDIRPRTSMSMGMTIFETPLQQEPGLALDNNI